MPRKQRHEAMLKSHIAHIVATVSAPLGHTASSISRHYRFAANDNMTNLPLTAPVIAL